MIETHRSSWPVKILLGLGLILIATSSNQWLCPVLLGVFLLLHSTTSWRFNTQPKMFWMLLQILPYGLWWKSIGTDTTSFETPRQLFYVGGYYLIHLGIYILYCNRGAYRKDAALAVAIMGITTAGVAENNSLFLPAMLLIWPLIIFHARQTMNLRGRINCRSRWFIKRILPVLLVGIVAFLFHTQILKRSENLDRWYREKLQAYWSDASPGFARLANLHSISNLWRAGKFDQVVIRVFGKHPGEYLRGAAYDLYRRGKWQIISEDRFLDSTRKHKGRYLYELKPTAEDHLVSTIYPLTKDTSIGFFMPLGTHKFSTFSSPMAVSDAITFQSHGNKAQGGYEIFSNRLLAKLPMPNDYRLAPYLKPSLVKIANRIMDPKKPLFERFARLERYFYEHFQYKIGINLITKKDPIIEFLEDIKAGHCEYFAAAGVLLLRAQGVAARYVTGFVCREKGGSGYWIVRRKDAHAWVEAFVPNQGWVTVDPTPPSGQPVPFVMSKFERWQQSIKGWLQRGWAFLKVGGVFGTLGLLWETMQDGIVAVPVWTWGVLISMGMLINFRKAFYQSWQQLQKQNKAKHSDVYEIQKKLRDAEKILVKQGLARHPAMTVTQLRREMDRAKISPSIYRQVVELLEQYQSKRFRKR